jgi:putative ABC transport system permease protein
MTVQSSGLIWAGLALALAAGVSLALEMGIARSIAWAGLRAFAQLYVLGLVLSWIFSVGSLPLIVGTVLLMTCVATHAVLGRISQARYPGILFHTFLSLALGAFLAPVFAGSFILESGSWKKAEIILPFAGLLLGNSISGISLGLAQWTRNLQEQRERIDTRLAHGATRWEAARPVIQDSIGTAMTPILNSMTVAGVVSLPGMMTGQLLAGANPREAVQYQIATLFLIAASTFFGVLLALGLGYRKVFNLSHQFHYQLFLKNEKAT